MPIEAVLNATKGLVVAPAGCGKTHLIIDALKIHPKKPYLVLTHTTAGVAALKQRLKKQVYQTNIVKFRLLMVGRSE